MRIVICGGGRTMEYMAFTMHEKKHNITVIEQDPEHVDRLTSVLPSDITIVEGDGCDPDILRDAELARADLFITMGTHDETNLVSCELAKTVFSVPRCISVVSNPRNRRIFKKMEIEVVSATELVERMVEEKNITTDMRMVFSLREGDITMVETKLPTRMRHRDGMQVAELPAIRMAQLICVVHEDGFEMINADTHLSPGATIIAAVESQAEDEFVQIIKHL